MFEAWNVAKFKGAEYFRKALYFGSLSLQFSAANDWKELQKIIEARVLYLPH